MNAPGDLAVVIVNYNTAALLADCLGALAAGGLDGLTATVWVVDNGSGDDSVAQAQAAALPVRVIANLTIGPSLGQDSIRQGIRAAMLAAVLVVLLMGFYYKLSGVIADGALMLNSILLVGLLVAIRATLTLPGIAGIALGIGMAVDSNVLILERIREELKLGKTVRSAIDSGYDKAFVTIVDSHVTTLITAAALFLFGTGPVKGFAVTLTVGVVASLFTSIYISRFIYDWVLEHHPDAKEISIGRMRIFHGTAFDFMKYKNHALAISWGIILVCLIASDFLLRYRVRVVRIEEA